MCYHIFHGKGEVDHKKTQEYVKANAPLPNKKHMANLFLVHSTKKKHYCEFKKLGKQNVLTETKYTYRKACWGYIA